MKPLHVEAVEVSRSRAYELSQLFAPPPVLERVVPLDGAAFGRELLPAGRRGGGDMAEGIAAFMEKRKPVWKT